MFQEWLQQEFKSKVNCNIIQQENYEYNLVDKTGNTKVVTKEDFVKAGLDKAMIPNTMTIDSENKKVIAKFEKFNYKK